MLRKVLFFGFVFVFFFNLTVSAQSADDLIKKNIKARGGYKKLKAIKSIKMTGKYLTGGIEAPFIFRAKRPDFLRVEVTIQGQTIIQAYDGQTAWWISPFQGITEPQAQPEERAKDFIVRADIDGYLVDYKKKGHKVELIGKKDVEGTEAYKLKVTLKNGNIWHVYLDAENFLKLKVFAKIKRRGREFEVDSYSSDYKKIDGVMFPHSYEDKIDGVRNEQIIFEKIELNVDVDDSVFKMPKKKEEKKTEK